PGITDPSTLTSQYASSQFGKAPESQFFTEDPTLKTSLLDELIRKGQKSTTTPELPGAADVSPSSAVQDYAGGQGATFQGGGQSGGGGSAPAGNKGVQQAFGVAQALYGLGRKGLDLYGSQTSTGNPDALGSTSYTFGSDGTVSRGPGPVEYGRQMDPRL